LNEISKKMDLIRKKWIEIEVSWSVMMVVITWWSPLFLSVSRRAAGHFVVFFFKSSESWIWFLSNFGIFDRSGLAYLFSDLKTVEKIQKSMFYNTSSGDSALTNFSSRNLAVLWRGKPNQFPRRNHFGAVSRKFVESLNLTCIVAEVYPVFRWFWHFWNTVGQGPQIGGTGGSGARSSVSLWCDPCSLKSL